MSLFEDASLIVTPNAVKAGKLYSIKPTDGSGDLSVVRATSATRANANGLIETVGANIPRLDYSNGSCPSILVEPQRTNLVINSNLANNNVGFTKITEQPSPDGLNNASLLTEVSLNNQKIVNSTTATISGNNTYAYSVFLKFNGIQNITINATDGISGFTKGFDILNGVIIGSSTGAFIIPYSNGWYRCVVIRTSGASATNGSIQINLGTYSGDGVKGFFWFGAQLEAGANATSYIPTVASAVTRNADVISKTGISDLINSSELTLFIDFDTNITNTSSQINILMLDDGTTSNYVASSIISNYVYTRTFSNGVFRQILGGPTAPQRFKVAIKIKQNSFKYFRNGVQITSGITDNNMPTGLNRIKLGENADSLINIALVFPTLLTDEQCIQLTTL
jgi:hypothetical protein